ncbi:hypothetical protein FQA39_LY16716 [Lamprigera yunnana]|nr:hypothetical protein FQA39_LY16716 [Lamprigera yunnana]
MPEKALFDVQLERRIQEQEMQYIKKMWMLYAEQHWTKAIDLKSAVERLYEKLGVLEFDVDHEEIYGRKKYYTIEQYEQLRDKYKIGRNCLKDRLSKIGLQHLLNTINKYIGNSDTSDEEEYKAVEQNGKGSETTKEKESKKSKATVAFQLWEKYANINFQQSFENPNIIISFKYKDHLKERDSKRCGFTLYNNELAHAFFPQNKDWNEELYDISKDKLSLFITLAHEIGHAIGIDHSPIHQSLMHSVYHELTSPFNAEDFELSDNQLAVASLYG